ncbi:MAG: SAM-dependent methyltransferase, partial [Acidobacteriota bacterium]
VLDALPVDRVRGAASCLQEVRVGLDGDRLVETCVPAGRELQDLLQKRLPAGMTDLAPGHEVEMCPTLGRFLAAVSRLIGRGYLLVVDYGHEIRERFHPSRRRGTMLAYRRHQASEDLLGFVGEQDLTSHVDFSALKKEAAAFGFRQAGCISQGRFLLALGLGERIEALEVEPISETERTRRRLAMASLVRPGGMGDLFRVWIAVREAPAKLRGLAEPFSSLQETGPV